MGKEIISCRTKLRICKVCGKQFPKPKNNHQRICDDCLVMTTKCTCSLTCERIIRKYHPCTGKLKIFNKGHSPQERVARSHAAKILWGKEGVREFFTNLCSSTSKRLWQDPSYREKISQAAIEKNHRYWADPSHRKRYGELSSQWLKGKVTKRWDAPEEIRDARILKMSGSNNPNWRGGSSFDVYTPAFTKILKKAIKFRQGGKCILCEETKGLRTHHIDYDKKNCHPNNLCAVCNHHHGKTNFNRPYWMELLTKLNNQFIIQDINLIISLLKQQATKPAKRIPSIHFLTSNNKILCGSRGTALSLKSTALSQEVNCQKCQIILSRKNKYGGVN